MDAEKLRFIPDATANRIYINADLTPSEAKAAYEERQSRRQRKQSATVSDGTTLSASAPSFVPASDDE